MTSANDFVFCVFEAPFFTYSLKLLNSYKRHIWNDEETQKKLEDIKKEIENIDYDAINNILNKLGKLQISNKGTSEEKKKRKLLLKEYSLLAEKYNEISETVIETSKGYHLIFYNSSDKEELNSRFPKVLYSVLINMSVRRGNKEWKIDKDMIFDIVTKKQNFYREILFSKTPEINQFLNNIIDILHKYINNKYPIKFKHLAVKNKSIECQESKNGILRGLVHSIGYVGPSSEEIFCSLFSSGHLEVQLKRVDQNSGIFTRLLGIGRDNIKDIYYVLNKSIFLIISLSALDDFDYWLTTYDAWGARTDTSFYKGFCHGCEGKLKSLQKYSAAERGYMAFKNEKSEKEHELVLNSDINLKRYVEAIYIPDKELFEKMMAKKEIPLWVKTLMTNQDDINKIYRKNCTGPEPPLIKKETFEKISKLVEKREKVTNILPLNIESINKKKKIELVYRDDTHEADFPPFKT